MNSLASSLELKLKAFDIPNISVFAKTPWFLKAPRKTPSSSSATIYRIKIYLLLL